jgi:hypothetical protein
MVFTFATLLFSADRKFARWTAWRVIASSGMVLLVVLYGQLAAGAETVDFRSPAAISYRQAKVLVEVEGKLKLNGEGQELKHLPLKASGELQYVERAISAGKQSPSVRLVREYRTAKADIRLHESELKNELRPDRQLICVQADPKSTTIFSPRGTLTREELDLVTVPGGGLLLDGLLPQRQLKTDENWPLEDGAVVRLLGLEAVSQHDLMGTLSAVKEGVAIISLAGKVTGAIGGVSSDIELKGKLNYDLKQKTITWLTLAYKENRAIGHSQPGFEVLTTLRMVVTPTQPVAALSDKALAGLPLDATASQTLIELKSESAGYELVHDRRWSVMLERPDLTVLRFVDQSDLVAQCNITSPPALPKGEQLSMAGFQEDVKRVLGKNFEEMVEATEETGDNGLRVLRVVVAGKVGELTIQWTYYHLSDEAGRRASFVFTIESSLMEKYAQIDRELMGNFRFIELKQPTPAGATSAVSATEAGEKVR